MSDIKELNYNTNGEKMKSLAVLLIISSALYAEIPYSAYNKVKDKQYFKDYIGAVGMGYSWSNIFNENIHGTKLYCSPSNLALETSNYVSILRNEINNTSYKEDSPIEMILMYGLIKTFPCKK